MKEEVANLSEIAGQKYLQQVNLNEKSNEEGSVAKQNSQLEIYKKQIVALKKELTSFYEFKMPFHMESHQLKSVANDRFPEGLLEKAKDGLKHAFADKANLVQVSTAMVAYLRANGPTQNWMCFIRPARLQKCVGIPNQCPDA